jgi:hypothetical protein
MNYEWNFPTLDVRYSVETGEGTLTNVVETVHWTLTAKDGDNGGYMYGSVAVGSPDPATFADYSSLTKETVQAWVEAALGEQVQTMKETLASQIEAQKAPQTGGLTPPWENTDL